MTYLLAAWGKDRQTNKKHRQTSLLFDLRAPDFDLLIPSNSALHHRHSKYLIRFLKTTAMSESRFHRPLRGGCQCGRNSYIIEVPQGTTEKAQVLFHTDSMHSKSLRLANFS